MVKRLFILLQAVLLAAAFATPARASGNQTITISNGLAMSGEPKYGPDFTHFDYVNPDAPKGGQVHLAGTGTYDSFNPFIPKGVAASGIGLVYDQLMVASDDEPFTKYGLLAEKVEVPADRSWIIFHIDPRARFHDNTPVTAEDVVFTFNLLMKDGSPVYKRYYANVSKAEVIAPLQAKFTFSGGTNPELPLIMGQMYVLPKHFWQDRDFAKSSLNPPLGSGPYRVKSFSPGKYVVYERADDYWAKDHPVNTGRYNFNTVRYDYYRDEAVSLQAFKAGEYDFRQETTSKVWATGYTGPQFKNGEIVKLDVEHENPSGMQAFVFNTRREKFKNKLVRKALTYAFDFEWTNRNLFYGQYKRTKSYFENSDMACRGLPTKEELKYLEPLRDQIPPEVFTEVYQPPVSGTQEKLRANLLKAAELLNQAGWTVKNGRLENAQGKPFTMEFLIYNQAFERVVLPFVNNLKRLGINCHIRVVDATQYVNRVRSFDYDMITAVIPQSLSPGNEQRYFFHSSAKDMPGSYNYAGISDPAVDQLVDKIIAAPNREELITRCRAMDRILLQGYYLIPNWYTSNWHLAFWNKFSYPKKFPPYGVGFFGWWIDKTKLERLEKKLDKQ